MLRAVYSLGRHSIDIFIVDAYNKSQHAMIKEARECNDVYNYMQYLNKHPEGGLPVNFVTLYAHYCHGITAIIILTEKILISI